jgi:inner membrane transporter RhtA
VTSQAVAIRSRLLAARQRRVPGPAFFVGSAVFHYLGPSFAVLLFARVEPLGVAWLRIVAAAVVYSVWRRPWRRWGGVDRRAVLAVLTMGLVLGLMNPCFYLAIARLPLATVAAIEFLPVILLAALGARTPRNLGALLLAAGGVGLLTDVRLAGAAAGFVLAFLNAGLFAAYIVAAHRVSRLTALGGLDGLATAMLAAALVVSPLGAGSGVAHLGDPVVLAAGLGVGVSSSVIPYVCDQLAMARMARATYALFVSLLPATATVVGVVVLRQLPSAVEVLGIALVVSGIALHREPAQASGPR